MKKYQVNITDGALKDMEQIRRMAVSYAPKVPYIMLGHSMGSYMLRKYLAFHNDHLAGAISRGISKARLKS